MSSKATSESTTGPHEVSLAKLAGTLEIPVATVVNRLVDLGYTLRWRQGGWYVNPDAAQALVEGFSDRRVNA